MESPLLDLPLFTMGLLLLLLLLIDLAFDGETWLYAAFVPVLLWAAVVAVKGRR